MIDQLKSILYFPIAAYFRFFAGIRLRQWKPKIIVVTGSNGKTTLLHLLESQIGEKAKFSHHANSSFGIPFDILGLERKSLLAEEWITLLLKAPFFAFHKPPEQSIYVVEADCDRPREGAFLAKLLKPDITLWVSTARTHSMNFDALVKQGKFETVEEAIAYEYGYFLKYSSEYVVVNGDSLLELAQLDRTKAAVKIVKKDDVLESYHVDKKHTTFRIEGKTYSFQALLPEAIFYSLVMSREVMDYLNLPFDETFSNFHLPPGRGSLFEGIKETILVDSSYNANLSSISAMVQMFHKLPVKKKWVVVGDMMELGDEEKDEHEKLAEVLENMDFERIILIGKRVCAYTYPKLTSSPPDKENGNIIESIASVLPFHHKNKAIVEKFLHVKDAFDYIHKNIQGEEAILFKGSQSLMLEALVEHLLKNKEHVVRLPRRENIWEERRKQMFVDSYNN